MYVRFCRLGCSTRQDPRGLNPRTPPIPSQVIDCVSRVTRVHPSRGSHLLFTGIGIIEPNDQFPLIHLSKILVQNCGLQMTDMQIATWLGREASYNLAHLRILETKRERRSRFSFLRLSLYNVVSDVDSIIVE